MPFNFQTGSFAAVLIYLGRDRRRAYLFLSGYHHWGKEG